MLTFKIIFTLYNAFSINVTLSRQKCLYFNPTYMGNIRFEKKTSFVAVPSRELCPMKKKFSSNF